MSEQITADQIKNHAGREVEVAFRGRVEKSGTVRVGGAQPLDSSIGIMPTHLAHQAATITLLPEPTPAEPTGEYAIVRGRDGRIYDLADKRTSYPWRARRSQGDYFRWEEVEAVEVIFPGIEDTK